ncbi:MAG: metallophosphoesterase [Anaerolineae bacterium]
MTPYDQAVAKRLNEVFNSAVIDEGREVDALRLVVLSDLHKGQRDGADDFAACERTYLAATEQYWQDDFELLLLGDIEELWENWPHEVLPHYTSVLNQERLFAETSLPRRYRRFVGNHDDLWYDSAAVQQNLAPYLAGQPVLESLRILVQEDGHPLGQLFLIHGHQGSPLNETLAGLSAWVVRHVWRPIQRLLNIRTSTPSTNFALRQQHELAMFNFAASRRGMVLIAGHTHHPVWQGLGLRQALEQAPGHAPLTQLDPAWLGEQVQGSVALPGSKPSYFNSGCCCYSDGSITGLELADGEIRLVRWTATPAPLRAVLFSAPLRSVFATVAS